MIVSCPANCGGSIVISEIGEGTPIRQRISCRRCNTTFTIGLEDDFQQGRGMFYTDSPDEFRSGRAPIHGGSDTKKDNILEELAHDEKMADRRGSYNQE